MGELIEVQPLTADDVKAMRGADDVTFHVNDDGCFVRVYVRDYRRPAIFTATQQRLYPDPHMHDCRSREIGIHAVVQGYNRISIAWQWRSTDAPGPRPTCFYSMYMRDEWSTLMRSIRVGDTLTADWLADNNSEITREAGLHVDRLRLKAESGREGDPARWWLIGQECGRDNSARMVQRRNVGS